MSNEVKKCETNAAACNSREATLPVVEPRADVFETENAVVILADLPGANEANVGVDLENDLLTLSAKAVRQLPENVKAGHRESRDREYRRAFRLSDRVNRDGVKATYKQGVLRVELPFREEVRPRKIDVEVG